VARYQPQPYEPDGGFSPPGLPLLFGVLFVAGVVFGWLASFIGQWFYLILVFPLGIGFCLALIGVFMGKVAKLRSPFLGGFAGLFAAVVAMLSIHWFDYQRFENERQELLALQFPEQVRGVPVQERMEIETAKKMQDRLRSVDSFAKFMNFEAEEGVTISSHGGKGGLNLGYYGSWIYWIAEFGVVAFLCFAGLHASAKDPFCTQCNSWKKERDLATLDSNCEELKCILEDGDLAKLRALQVAPVPGVAAFISAAVCPTCGATAPIAVKLGRIAANAKGEKIRTEVLHVNYPGDALAELEAILAAPAAEPVPECEPSDQNAPDSDGGQ
jgi:hypothetical protein